MSARTGHLALIVSVAALVLGGSAAAAIPLAPVASAAGPAASLAGPVALPAGPVASPAERVFTGTAVQFARRMLLADLGPGPAAAKNAPPSSNDAFAQLSPDGFAAYATGTAYHTDAELSGKEVSAEIDLATSDAAYASQALPAFSDELGRPVAPDLAAGNGFGRGRAVQVTPPEALGSAADLRILDPAEAKAPPSSAPVTKQTQTNASPLLKADSFKAEASARAVPTGCVIGNDLARGFGSANDTDIADLDPDAESTEPLLSIGADEPPRAVSQSLSRTALVFIKETPGRFGLVAETRQTVAPITFSLPGTKEKFTIELGGEWVLRARSDGTKGLVSFGPEPGSGDQPMLRLIQNGKAIDEVTLRDLGGRTGIFLDGRPIGEIRIGEESRAVGGKAGSKPTATATRVAAAVDVVAMRVFDPPTELRVGHMEVALALPAGGVECPGIGMKKEAQPAAVRPGERFSWTIAVSNPNDCVLDKVKVVDTASTTPEVVWRVITTAPRSTLTKDGTLTFDGVGPIRTGETKTLRIEAEVDGTSVPGTVTNQASAAGNCGPAPVAGATGATLTVQATPSSGLTPSPSPTPVDSDPGRSPAGAQRDSLVRPAPASADERSAAAVDEGDGAGSGLPRTGGGTAGLLLGTSLLGAGALLRRVRRRRHP